MPAQQGLAPLHHPGSAIANRLVEQFELFHVGRRQRQTQVVFQALLVAMPRQQPEIEQIPSGPAPLFQRNHRHLHAALHFFHSTAVIGIQRRTDPEDGNQGTPP
ncbi:hypothetical protein D3C72_1942320 [compost metagenome]